MNAWHQDQITRLPADARPVGSSEFCRFAALAYSGRAFSVQAHPEFNDAEIQRLLSVRRAALSEEQAEEVRAGIGKPLSNSDLADRIAAFFKEPAHV